MEWMLHVKRFFYGEALPFRVGVVIEMREGTDYQDGKRAEVLHH
jgi:hypothetical protein